MKFQKTKLAEQLSKYGWDILEVETENLDWWADEMWLITSKWSPVGSRAYITFLVDPQTLNSRSRKKGEDVWAVKSSPIKPIDWLTAENEFTLNLGQGWNKSLPSFFEHLAALRSQNKEHE